MGMSLFFAYLTESIFDWFAWDHLACVNVTGGQKACIGGDAIIRMSFALACTHIIILLAMLPRNDASA